MHFSLSLLYYCCCCCCRLLSLTNHNRFDDIASLINTTPTLWHCWMKNCATVSLSFCATTFFFFCYSFSQLGTVLFSTMILIQQNVKATSHVKQWAHIKWNVSQGRELKSEAKMTKEKLFVISLISLSLLSRIHVSQFSLTNESTDEWHMRE